MTGWIPKTHAEACLRDAARRRYLAQRQAVAAERRRRVVDLIAVFGTGVGAQARIARELGVNRSTVCRDFRVLLAKVQQNETCPLCGRGPARSSSPGSAE